MILSIQDAKADNLKERKVMRIVKKTTGNRVAMNSAEFEEMTDTYQGVCTACGETQEGCEPDAEKYTCESCGRSCVYGAEQLMLLGRIDFEESDDFVEAE